MIIDKSCISKLDFFTDLESLRDKQIRKELIILRHSPIPIETPIILFLVPPLKSSLQLVEKQIACNIEQTPKELNSHVDFYVIITPKINLETSEFIKDSKYRSHFKVKNLNIDIYPLDYDLMSIEENQAIESLFVKNDMNLLSLISRSILKIETIFGKIKNKYYKGTFAKELDTILSTLETNSKVDFEQNPNEILACMMIDRSVDFISPFCSQYTYEGVLDDYFGINLNAIRVKPSILEKESKNDKIKLDLSRKDPFYSMIKNYNFNKVRMFLPERLNLHSSVISEGKNSTDLKEIQKSLENVKIIKEERASLTNHINLADYIATQQRPPFYRYVLRFEQALLVGGDIPPTLHQFYENEIAKKGDEVNLLRILCIESLVQKSIKKSFYDKIKREFINTYGFQEIFLLSNLEKAKILRCNNDYSYDSMNSKLKLIYEKVDIYNPNDSSYAYGGYSPITIRLIEAMISKGWGKIKDILKKLPGGEFSYPENEKEIVEPSKKSFILLVFIGGITYGEIGAIRYLNETHPNHKFIILTTGIVNSKKIIDSLRGNTQNDDPLTMKSFYSQFDK